jgi:adapter protein MecA 1/2
LDDLILLSEKLISCNVSGGRLFSFEDTFYLKFEENEIGRLDRETFYALLAEYGNPSTRTIYRIIEYGKELLSENAIQQLHFYFVEKKTSQK